MPANKMTVNTSLIGDAVKDVKNSKEKFKQTYESIFNEFVKIDDAWDGDDNAVFNEHVISFKKDFQAMDEFFDRLVNFLNDAKEKYEDAENDRKNASQRLAR